MATDYPGPDDCRVGPAGVGTPIFINPTAGTLVPTAGTYVIGVVRPA